ncbi:MAG TPA: TIGR03560 family F420-dependent LLM class oxidoreductase [Micromonosporaceae bacterium]|nr:TIGR03560 family F420-dependent LLM class oxidoreductase [Micromonosporaceae bacterium]
MKISLSITNFSWPGPPSDIGEHLATTARAAEAAGLDTVWVADHLIQADPASRPDEPMLEAYTTLGFLAGQTRTIGLGTMVTGATFRAPALLIKAVTTLDVLSRGRAWLGIGAGYQTSEASAMGLDSPSTSQRFDVLADTIDIANRMWSGDQSAFHGRRHHLDHPIGSPLPVSRPRPRLLIGGTGERRTLRLVAQHADACNLFDIPDGGVTVRRQLSILGQHCADIGRPVEEIEKTISTALSPHEPASRFVDHCGSLGEAGIDHVVVITRGMPWTDEAIDTLGTAAGQLKAA